MTSKEKGQILALLNKKLANLSTEYDEVFAWASKRVKKRTKLKKLTKEMDRVNAAIDRLREEQWTR